MSVPDGWTSLPHGGASDGQPARTRTPRTQTRAQVVGGRAKGAAGATPLHKRDGNRNGRPAQTKGQQTRAAKRAQRAARRFPPARQRSRRHPTDARTGAVSRGKFPARRGYIMRRSRRATPNATDGRTKRPPGRANGQAGRTRQGNGAAEPSEADKPNERPAQTSEGRDGDQRETPPADAPPQNERPAQTRRTAQAIPPNGRGAELQSQCGSLRHAERRPIS